MTCRFCLVALSLAMVMLFLSGCVGEVMQQAQTASKRKEMFEILKAAGLARHEFHDRNNRFPKSWEEFQSVGVGPDVRQKLEAEGYTVILGMEFAEMKSGTSRFMWAFPSDGGQNGGLVALADGSVRQITAEEFNEFWKDQEPTMKNAVVLKPPAASVSPAGSGGGSAPPPPPSGY